MCWWIMQNAAIAKAGNTTIVNLRPFETYSIQLKDNGTELVSMNAREETVTLYPGNVKRFVYKVEKIDVVFGRIVSADGKAIKNALIEGVAGIAITDDYGFFQARA